MDKTSKKNIITKIAVICLAVVMITSSIAGITFARYIKESNTTNQNGDVAAFGVTMNAPTGTLFNTTYARTDVTYTSITNSVESAGATFAPGTNNGDGFEVSATINDNEVAVELQLVIDTFGQNWTVNELKYEPIKFTLSKTEGASTKYWNGFSWVDEEPAAKLSITDMSDINAAKGYDVGQDNLTVSYKLTWVWDFEDDTTVYQYKNGETYSLTNDGGEYTAVSNDVLDTKLGEAEEKASLDMMIFIIATQID